jgi:hypothetical protein
VLYIVVALILFAIAFGGTRLVKSMDGGVQGAFAALESKKGWWARLAVFMLRHPAIGFFALAVLLIAGWFLWIWATYD